MNRLKLSAELTEAKTETKQPSSQLRSLQDLLDVKVAALEELTAQLGRRSRLDLCLAYSRGLPWITQVLAGSETAAQLQETIELFQSTSALTAAEIATVDERLVQLAAEGCIPPRLLNAGEWIDPEDIEASKGHDMAQGLYQGPGSKLKLTTANL